MGGQFGQNRIVYLHTDMFKGFTSALQESFNHTSAYEYLCHGFAYILGEVSSFKYRFRQV